MRVPLQAFRKAAALHRMVPLWGLASDGVFLTKRGYVGVVCRVAGPDLDGVDVEGRRALTHHYETALRLLDERFRVYQYYLKTPAGPGGTRTVFDIDVYLVVLYEGVPARAQAGGGWWRGAAPAQTVRILRADLAAATTQLLQAVAAITVHLAPLGVARVGPDDVWRFYRRVCNLRDAGVRRPRDTHLDYAVADEGIEDYGGALRVGGVPVQVITMKEPPAATFPAMFAHDFAGLPGAFLACLEWARWPVAQQQREIWARQGYFHQRETRHRKAKAPGEGLTDTGAAAEGDQMAALQVETQVHGHFLGACSLTVAVAGADADDLAARVVALLAAQDGAAVIERYNAANAFFALWPGNAAFNCRRLGLLETHAADLSFLTTVNQGRERDDAGRAPLLRLVTPQQTAYRYHLHVQDVPHTLVLGAVGSGKTTAVNEIVWGAQQYRPRTLIFDYNHGFRALAQELGGSTLEFGPDTGVAINPLASPLTASHHEFLTRFLQLLIEGQDGMRCSTAQVQEIADAVTRVYHLALPVRRFGALFFPSRDLRLRFADWRGPSAEQPNGGRYQRVFDHGVDALAFDTVQAFNFERLQDYPALAETIPLYLFHLASEGLSPDVLTLCVFEEAWRCMGSPLARAYLSSMLLTWRQKNGAVILITQALEHFRTLAGGVVDEAFLHTVVEACATKWLLANPERDEDFYQRTLHLNAAELDLLRQLRPKGQALIKREHEAKVVEIEPRKREMAYA